MNYKIKSIDLDYFKEIVKSNENIFNFYFLQKNFNKEEIKNILNKTNYTYIYSISENDKMVSVLSLLNINIEEIEIDIILSENQECLFESIILLIDEFKENDFKKIHININSYNYELINLIEKIGFVLKEEKKNFKKYIFNLCTQKGIVLSGGTGSRLYPITIPINKQLLPIYNKPMIYYPISILMLSEIKDILIISTPSDLPLFKKLLGDGSQIGIKFNYIEQLEPKGISEAFIIGKNFIGSDNVSLILGDNIFYGHGFTGYLKNASKNIYNATIFGYKVNDPYRFGIVEFDKNQNVINLEEKPKNPKSNWAVTGLYYYTNDVVEIVKKLQPSNRGELEITDLNKEYLKQNRLKLEKFGRGINWLDTGTYYSLLKASNFIETIETGQGISVACLEEIAYKNKWIDKKQLLYLSKKYNNSYGKYLEQIIEEE